MATMEFAPIKPRHPVWKFEVFNTSFSPSDAKGGDLHQDFDPLRCGWYTLDHTNVVPLKLSFEDKVDQKSTGSITVDGDDTWMFGLEMISKCGTELMFDAGPITPTTQPQVGSKVALYIDDTGLDEFSFNITESVGIATVVGDVDTDELLVGETNPVSDEIVLRGRGMHFSDRTFTHIDTLDVEMNSGQIGPCLSWWANLGNGIGTRECRVLCDTNDDGIYGIVAGGYIREGTRSHSCNYTDVTLNFVGYRDFLMSNEYITGYRTPYLCQYYDGTADPAGNCTADPQPDVWRNGNYGCYVGDYQPVHPNGDVVQDTVNGTFKCLAYVADTSKPVPFDGWQYYEEYSDDSIEFEAYEYYPYAFARALRAVCNMANSTESGKVVSREWDLAKRASYNLYAAVATDSVTTIQLDARWEDVVTVNDDISGRCYLQIDDEIIRVSSVVSGGPGITNVNLLTRGSFHTKAVAHDIAAEVIVYDCMYVPTGSTNVNPLCNITLSEANLKHTIDDTLKSHAKNAMFESVNEEYATYVDPFRQIHMFELDLDNTGSECNTLTIKPVDVIGKPQVSLGPITNKVTCKVTMDDDSSIYASMTAEDSGHTNYDKSLSLFGRRTEEVNNGNLDTISKFNTYAKNYLKMSSFPVLTQVIEVDCFVPDEHYYGEVDTSNTDFLPYLRYTDKVNNYINVIGTKVDCPDFWLPKIDGEYQTSTFVFAGLKYKVTGAGNDNFVTYITLRRRTTPEDWS